MNKQQKIALVLGAAMAISHATALADAPTSQFGFKGWPYRQSAPCTTKRPQIGNACEASQCPTSRPSSTPCVTNCPAEEPTCSPCATDRPVATATPTTAPTQQPTAAPTPVPTPKPTRQPTAQPTKKPQATVQPTAAPSQPSTGDDYTTEGVTAQEEIAYRLLNQDRAANGMGRLTLDSELCRLARMKSTDMKINRYFAHTSPTLGNAAAMLKNAGYSFVSVGENIAHHATVEKAQAAFMSSSGHRTNILGSQWSKVGIGVCYDDQGYVYVTQLFVR